MATIKLGNTKQASRAINYAEKRAVEKSGLNCDVNYAKSSFKALRALYDKEEGIQAHTIIQSFKPGEIDPKKANEIGLELAQRVAGTYQVTVFTHADTEHIHNHIVINSVDMETGKKYQSDRSQMKFVKEQSNKICRDHGLSVIDFEKKADVTYTMAEKALIEKGKIPWKDELRQAIEYAKENSTKKEEFVESLKELGIEFKDTNKTVSYLHPDQKRFVRGSRLGQLYDKEAIENGFRRQIEREDGRSVDWDYLESKVGKTDLGTTERDISRQASADRTDIETDDGRTESNTEVVKKRIGRFKRREDELER